jgi:hypothetical protein
MKIIAWICSALLALLLAGCGSAGALRRPTHLDPADARAPSVTSELRSFVLGEDEFDRAVSIAMEPATDPALAPPSVEAVDEPDSSAQEEHMQHETDGPRPKAIAAPRPKPKAARKESRAALYVCPMHPEVTDTKPSKCPKCGMTLVRKVAK